jgi:hypothetical protein
VIGLDLCNDARTKELWRSVRDTLPVTRSVTVPSDLAIGPPSGPRVLWMLTV